MSTTTTTDLTMVNAYIPGRADVGPVTGALIERRNALLGPAYRLMYEHPLHIVRGEGEDTKVAVRNLRREANETLKKLVKDKLASEDDQKRSEADIQKMTDRHITEIDRLVASKEQDIMAV